MTTADDSAKVIKLVRQLDQVRRDLVVEQKRSGALKIVKSLGTVTPISRPIATPLRLEIAPFEDLLEGWCRSCG
jgi:hypothetical protein